MNSPTSQPADSRSNDDTSVISIDASVETCAASSTTQAEFLQTLASHLSESFDVAIVAVDSPQWASPMMLVRDQVLASRIDRVSIRDLLSTAAVVPIACDVPLETPADDGTSSTRSIRVELTDAPRRAAILLIYSAETNLTATEQLLALKKLSEYTGCARSIMERLPSDDVQRGLSLASVDQDELAVALRARQSLTSFHRDLDLDATAFRVANESRRLLDCDRTTVLLPHGRKYKVRAMSGVAVIDSRSNSVRSLERLALRASVMSRPMVLPSEEPLPPQIQDPLDDYLDETGVMTAIMLPLYETDHEDADDGLEAAAENPFQGNGDIVAMLFLEYFSGQAPDGIGPATSIIASEALYSLRNSMEHRNVFGLRLWKGVGNLTRSGKFPLIAAGFLCVVGLLVASVFIEVEHHVVATGNVEPLTQRQVFASVDGVVKEIHVKDGQKVSAGDPLFQLENADLENRAETLTGEIMTASKRLASIQSLRLSSLNDPSQSSRMALEERQLESELMNLRAQQDLILAQQADLVVTSPIDGTIVGWQLERRLSDRPVSRGNLLVRVVDHSGDWSLRLNIPDQDAGPVLQAIEESNRLPVRFAVATDPESSFAADLISVATAARKDELGQHVIDGTAAVDVSSDDDQDSTSVSNDVVVSDSRQQPVTRLAGAVVTKIQSTFQGDGDVDSFRPDEIRVGADVTARIACGKRSVMRSWFSDVFDFVDRNVLFYFR